MKPAGRLHLGITVLNYSGKEAISYHFDREEGEGCVTFRLSTRDKGTFFADALNLESLIALKEAIEIVIKVLEDTYY